ncbi:MAG: hypothetical protein WAP08_04810 [Smithellaceae bacterium]|jgi:hypothetical protein|nr:hypothetical protein [Syntrophaceae bacterium]
MIDFIFTIDYEIYGNGEGSLKDLVFEPTCQLKKILDRENCKMVFFIEAAELEKIEEAKSDPAIDSVKNQIKELHEKGHEIALHLHPQWYNGTWKNGKWDLDYSEYNLCTLPETRINQIVERAINYLRKILCEPEYKPFSFRAGNWLFQPTQPAALILFNHGIRIDSSVFKGGLQHQTRLDYRRSLKNGYFWQFQDDVNEPAHTGYLIEIPIYTEMVPPWRMATKKRLALQQKAATGRKTLRELIDRLRDLARPFHPLKLDFCRMTFDELITITNKIIRDDKFKPDEYKPIATIGHTKDLTDFDTISLFLAHLKQNNIQICTFKESNSRL